MLSLIHLFSAWRRLKESDKTVLMLGGRKECPPMIQAQNDMIRYELDFYKEESLKFIRFVLGLIIVSMVGGVIYFKCFN